MRTAQDRPGHRNYFIMEINNRSDSELSSQPNVPLSYTVRRGTGPLYWSAYEYPFLHNKAIPEERWRRNIDWVAAEFSPFGYRMVCTDGWIENSTRTNANGYILSHDDSWAHGWGYWVDYCRSKGLALGVYYNPLWVAPSAVADPSKRVAGTDIPVSGIVDAEYRFPGENHGQTGDRFAYTQGGGALYWVDVEKPGAKEYVQGYVRYFRDMGIQFLRVDFLSWYEDGMDKGRMVGRSHGTENYRTALDWICEAAGGRMDISLVMPHLKNNGESELHRGQLARIDEDCGTGGWENFSDRDRGRHFDRWSQFSNAFDGLVYWSRYLPQAGMIPDADMLRLNTFADDEERKSAVSLCLAAGAPVDIGDQFDTIGGSAWIYRNPEMLELNRRGFRGAPLSADPRSPLSQTWVGKMGDASWIAAFFNREKEPELRGIDFQAVLGIPKGSVRDLWEHQDLGKMDRFSKILSPHSCTVLKIAP